MSRVFSISLNELTFAQLGELQKKYPDMSRNAMVNHIINVVHSGEMVDYEEERKSLISALQRGADKRKHLESELKRYQSVFGFIGGEKYE